MHLHLLLERYFAVIVIGSMAKLQKAARALVSRRSAFSIGGAGGRGDEEGHFHPTRLRGRRPPLPYSADPL